MTWVEHTMEIDGPACYGRTARPRAVGAVLDRVVPTVRDSVRMAFLRSSRRVGRPLKELQTAWNIRFSGQSEGASGATVLHFEALRLGEASPGLFEQSPLWDDSLDPQDTGFDLVAEVIRDVGQRRRDSDRFDTGLLNRIARYESVFKRGVRTIRLGGARLDSQATVTIDKPVTDQARSLISETPPSKRVRVSGVLDMIRVSDQAFELLLHEGHRVRAVWTKTTVIHLAAFLNQHVLIEGEAVFRPSGSLLRVDTSAIKPATEADLIYSKVPAAAGPGPLIERVRRPQRPGTGAIAIYGNWPGDESEEELLTALEELDG